MVFPFPKLDFLYFIKTLFKKKRVIPKVIFNLRNTLFALIESYSLHCCFDILTFFQHNNKSKNSRYRLIWEIIEHTHYPYPVWCLCPTSLSSNQGIGRFWFGYFSSNLFSIAVLFLNKPLIRTSYSNQQKGGFGGMYQGTFSLMFHRLITKWEIYFKYRLPLSLFSKTVCGI